jgi:Rhs element Vgr protein
VTAPSPELNAGRMLAATLKVGGKAFDSDAIVSIETWSEANRIPRARIVIYDGAADSGAFPLGDSKTFVPGTKLVVEAGYGSGAATIHSGRIVRHAIRIVPGMAAQLIVESADPLINMTLGRHDVVTPKTCDHALIAKLIADNDGEVGENEAGSDPIEALVQYHATDWDLLLLRAEANGCVVLVEAAKVDIVSPTKAKEPVLTATYGDSIIALEATADATVEISDKAVKSRSWSYTAQTLSEGAASGAEIVAPGNFTTDQLARVFAVDPVIQQSGAFLSETQLGAWSTARAMRAHLARVRGSARFQGTAAVKPGCFIALGGVGERFNGKAFVSAVHHSISGGSWTTSVDFGMDPDRFASRNRDLTDPPAAGLVPPIRGLHTGQVKQVAPDPNGDLRVLVTLPLLATEEGVWARLGQFYASSGFGAAFFPEVGDEVVLGFMDEDPANPVILASVYSAKRPPQAPPNDANDIKALVTRSKIEINFDDKDVVLKISTPKSSILLDDKAEIVKIADSSGNSIEMAKDKVDIVSGSALNLKSAQDMTISCGASLTISAAAKMSLNAPELAAKADAKLSLASGGMGELKAGAVLTISGPLVKIN